VANEANKAGVTFDQLNKLASQVAELPNLHFRGLMAIPQKTDNIAMQRQQFASVRRALASLNQSGFSLDTLSMGMSHDLEAAIAEGATIIRVGTAIFGPRKKPQ